MKTNELKTIYLAGGCFWGVEAYYDQLKGIKETSVGFAQGHKDNPTYEEVCTGSTGHTETTMVQYDPTMISLNEILDHFFRVVNPFTINRQGNDIGSQYRSGIYYENKDDIETIQRFINNKQKEFDKKIMIEVEPLNKYWKASENHQKYLDKNPNGYCHIDLGLAKKDEVKEIPVTSL